MTTSDINGILLLYHQFPCPDAPVVSQNIDSFKTYSRYNVWQWNTENGFPDGLERLRFSIIVLHYTLFANTPYKLTERFLEYLADSRESYKIAFFQDEYRCCRERFAFINDYRIDCIYTLLEQASYEQVYGKHTRTGKIIYCLAGYVSDELVETGSLLSKPDEERAVDIGYRSRETPYYLGKGAREKFTIAGEFIKRAMPLDLKLDISCSEETRIYGMDWFRFIAGCRAMLGTESGPSAFDVTDKIRSEVDQVFQEKPNATFEEVWERVIWKYEDRIYHRAISPRVFEAAALETCQILFEGRYSGLIEPMKHYIPLKKDFSNFDEVIRLFRDSGVRRELTENAYRDLIESGSYSYRAFYEEFDSLLAGEGLEKRISDEDSQLADSILSEKS